jgi:hypothetical protein
MSDIKAIFNKDKRKLIIEVPIEEVFIPSKKTGKTLLVASSHGTQKCGLKIDNEDLRISINAFIPNPAFKKCPKFQIDCTNDDNDSI